MATNGKKLKPVIVTTAHRGVFFGYASKTDSDTINKHVNNNQRQHEKQRESVGYGHYSS